MTFRAGWGGVGWGEGGGPQNEESGFRVLGEEGGRGASLRNLGGRKNCTGNLRLAGGWGAAAGDSLQSPREKGFWGFKETWGQFLLAKSA